MKPRISIIIPAYNEIAVIRRTLAHLRALPLSQACEIVVVDGHPDRTTLAVIPDGAARKIASPKGRGRQMNAGAREAGGDILLFLHADTFLPEGGIESVLRAMTAPDVVAGAFDLGIDSSRRVFRVIERTASLRSRMTRIPYGDQAIFIRASLFRRMGGFAEIPIMEDVELMARIKNGVRRDGGRIVFLPERVRTSARRWEKEGIVYGTLRNWALVSLYRFGVSPERLARFYR